MPPKGETLDVFKDKIRGFQFNNEPNKFPNKRISRIVERSMTDQRKPLTRRSTKDQVDGTITNTLFPNFAGPKCNDGLGNDRAAWKIEKVSCSVNRIDFDGSNNVKTGLLEAETHPSGSGKEIYGYGASKSHPWTLRNMRNSIPTLFFKERYQLFFKISRSPQLALPNDHAFPAGSIERSANPRIAIAVGVNFLPPIS